VRSVRRGEPPASGRPPRFCRSRHIGSGRPRHTVLVGEQSEKFLDWAAKPFGPNGGMDLRVFWNAVPHSHEGKNSEGKDWSQSEPDPKAP
jgi:hypothetical protein